MGTLERYAKMNNTSLSSVISDSVALTVHIFEQCLRYQWSIKELKNDLLKFTIKESINRARGALGITQEEHCSLIWKTNIRSPLKIPVSDYFQLNANDEFMGKDEKIVLRERLSSLREDYDMEKAIYIYNQRKFDETKQSVSGDSNIILIHKTSFEDYYFDVGEVRLFSTSQLIIFGVNEVLRRKEVVMPYPVICWIDIYHVNEMIIMLPVIHKKDASSCIRAPDDIIINPYSQENKN
ncbi:hypothetical protein [Klebsiella oxytoca]|uniref:hypothetical protein n=1 Tax=Klebsiella oxytoca TaxID=571 RepID=UPI001D10C279|nr:hypothetical protein [Klebsiella oxytoca]